MRSLTASSFNTSPVSRLTKTAIGTPQARWRETTQSGRFSIMPRRRFCPAAGTKRVSAIAFSARARSVSPLPPIGLVSMWMNHCGVLRKMTGFLERQECGYWCFSRPRAISMPAVDQRVDHRGVGVALLAGLGDDRRPVEAGRVRGEAAVRVDRIGNRRVDAALLELAPMLHPDVEVLAAVAGRGVHEAGAGFLGDMLAGKQRHVELIAAEAGVLQRMRQHQRLEVVRRDRRERARSSRRAPASSRRRRACRRARRRSPVFAQFPSGAAVDLVEPVGDLRRIATARLPGIVHGVVVQITTEAPRSVRGPEATGNFTQTVSDV